MKPVCILGTEELTRYDLLRLAQVKHTLQLGNEVRQKIIACRNYLDAKLESSDAPIYGINTGFGALHNTRIQKQDLEQLQLNLICSHACGAGSTMPDAVVKWMLFLKIRSLAYGHSGVTIETVERLIDFYNHDIFPVIYSQGSLGASGDLAPLAHLCLPIAGLGKVSYKGEIRDAKDVLSELHWAPIQLKAKEGLAMLNGTQFMLACAVQGMISAMLQIEKADIISALSLDAFDCRQDPFHPAIHRIRPHAGQVQTAERISELRQDSPIAQQPKTQVQDPYSFRCIPQVHGASKDALEYAFSVFMTEVNSVTDNPNIFPEEDCILSGGNFHGQPLALALDFMAIALAELGSISERRTYLLLSGQRNLPAFLVSNPGLNSGLMIAQYLAASVASQNKQLCTPASVDSIPSSNGQEDHVSMGANAAIKMLQVSDNLNTLLGIECMHASQAMYFREPLLTSPELQAFLSNFRSKVPLIHQDRILSEDIRTAAHTILQYDVEL
jgi:histidine ammonia-lyase